MKFQNVLITNDDGYDSIGISILKKYFKSNSCTSTTVAPKTQHSGASSSITIYGKLKVEKTDKHEYAVEGTPVDCTKFALKNVLENKPDLVVSGINKGDNAGQSVLYSGTVGAAYEAALQGIDSVALSLFTDADEKVVFDTDALYKMVEAYFQKEYCEGFVSVNFPHCSFEEFKGFKWIEISTSTFVEKYTEVEDGVYEIGLDYYREDENSETYYLKDNWATISPIITDWTDRSKL